MKKLLALILLTGVLFTVGCKTPPCEEDQPCWDCTTMGNLICGPDGG